MKTINTYSFAELSEEAKEKAISDYRSKGFEYAWQDENIESLNTFCALFGVSVTDWSIGTWGHSYIETNAENSHFRGWNKAKVAAIPEFLTGYCLDCAFVDAFKREFEKTGDALQSFNEAIDAGLKDWVADLEYQESDEYISEHLITNEYQFLEMGGGFKSTRNQTKDKRKCIPNSSMWRSAHYLVVMARYTPKLMAAWGKLPCQRSHITATSFTLPILNCAAF